MKAAVASGAAAPRWTDFADPVAAGGEVLVNMSAAAVSPLVRARAAGMHYSASGASEVVAGVDGVGRLADGRRVFCAFPSAPWGTIAQLVPIPTELCAPVPEALDDVTAAALANPGMSSYLALLDRAHLNKGETVLVNGATGAAGRLAITVAKHLGAGRVIATGRNAAAFVEMQHRGADRCIDLTLPELDLVDAFYGAVNDDGVAVVLDYLWGASAEALLKAIARPSPGAVAARIRFVQIGAVSGATIALDGSILRGSGVELLGSGLRSVPLPQIVSRIGEMLAAAPAARFTVDVLTRPMQDVQTAWNEATAGRRLVLTLSTP